VVPTQVSDARSNRNDQIDHAVRAIGRSKDRFAVFQAIYFGKAAAKTVEAISKRTHLPRKRVLEEGKRLASQQIVEQTKVDGKTAYRKDPFYAGLKQRIIALVKNPVKLASLPTKTRPQLKGFKNSTIVIRVAKTLVKIRTVSIDDIAQFKKVKSVKNTGPFTPMPEAQFKNGVKKLLGELGAFSDWGGEKNDLLTTRLRVGEKRMHAAIAFKGPGKKGVLTPKAMGKNGDQIQRLFQSPAEVFMVQYWGQIGEAVMEQMSAFAQLTAGHTGKQIYYGIIDGHDSNRLILSYPKAFKKKSR
jgi:hypothetical protein